MTESLQEFLKRTDGWCGENATVVAIDRQSSNDDEVKVSPLPLSCGSKWVLLPSSAINEIEQIGFDTCCGKAFPVCRLTIHNDFSSVVNQLLSIARSPDGTAGPAKASSDKLRLFRDNPPTFLDSSDTGPFGTGWNWPWTWSECAKCELAVNLYLTVTVIAAAAAAGTTGPGAIAVWEALIVKKYGFAAWKAVEAYIFSEGTSSIAQRICEADGCGDEEPSGSGTPCGPAPRNAEGNRYTPAGYRWECNVHANPPEWYLVHRNQDRRPGDGLIDP